MLGVIILEHQHFLICQFELLIASPNHNSHFELQLLCQVQVTKFFVKYHYQIRPSLSDY